MQTHTQATGTPATKRSRSTIAAVLTATLLAALTMTAAPSSAAPQTTYSATISHDSNCVLTVTASWPRSAPVSQVFVMWQQDGAYWATSEPAIAKKDKSVQAVAGPLESSIDTHNHDARVQFYVRGAQQLAEVFTNVDAAPCALPTPTA